MYEKSNKIVGTKNDEDSTALDMHTLMVTWDISPEGHIVCYFIHMSLIFSMRIMSLIVCDSD